MSITKAIYIVYDFGLRADYAGLYAWLDSIGAKECGDYVALIQKEFGKDDHNLIYAELKKEITERVKLEPTDRIYISLIGNDGNLKGKFLFGGRKRAVWEGYAVSNNNLEDSF